MNKLLEILLGLFVLGVVDGEVVPDPENPNPEEPIQPELDLSTEEEPAPVEEPAETDPKIALEAERRARADAEARAKRYEQEMADLRARSQASAQTEEQRLRAEEDRRLADPNTPALEKWQIESNRTIRSTQAMAAQTAFQAADTSDRSSFEMKCSTNKRLAFVKDKVEEQLRSARAQGQNPSRETIAYYILGQMAANATPKAKPAAAASPRGGKTVSARGDVPGKTGMSDREKRRARLENVQI